MEKNYSHYSVLLNESIEGLNINKDGIYVDCTLGGGGHSSVILSKLENKNIKFESFEQIEKLMKKYKLFDEYFLDNINKL